MARTTGGRLNEFVPCNVCLVSMRGSCVLVEWGDSEVVGL